MKEIGFMQTGVAEQRGTMMRGSHKWRTNASALALNVETMPNPSVNYVWVTKISDDDSSDEEWDLDVTTYGRPCGRGSYRGRRNPMLLPGASLLIGFSREKWKQNKYVANSEDEKANALRRTCISFPLRKAMGFLAILFPPTYPLQFSVAWIKGILQPQNRSNGFSNRVMTSPGTLTTK